jgi:hypothetical protein
MDRYDIGDLVRLTASFTDVDGGPVEPGTVELVTRDPAGDETTHEAVSDGGGAYHVDLEPDQAGTWGYRWVSTGAGQGAEPGQFHVRPAFYPTFRPSVAKVASKLPHRTYGQGGGSTGTFTDQTTPTVDEAEAAIDTATTSVTSRLPATIVPATHTAAVADLISLRAAMEIEVGYPVSGQNSPYDRLKALYDDELKGLVVALKDAGDGTVDGSTGGGLPTHTFPPAYCDDEYPLPRDPRRVC